MDLRRAWQVARSEAETGAAVSPIDRIGISFRNRHGHVTNFLFDDLDAACWAAAVDRVYGLDTVNGVSVLFRLLALIELMAEAGWLRPYFTLDVRAGASLHPALLATAASEPLLPTAKFDAGRFRLAMGLGAEKKPPRRR
jgi:hypothetical protein